MLATLNVSHRVRIYRRDRKWSLAVDVTKMWYEYLKSGHWSLGCKAKFENVSSAKMRTLVSRDVSAGASSVISRSLLCIFLNSIQLYPSHSFSLTLFKLDTAKDNSSKVERIKVVLDDTATWPQFHGFIIHCYANKIYLMLQHTHVNQTHFAEQ